MSQIEKSGSTEILDSKTRAPRQQLWKYANIHSLIQAPVQIPRATGQKSQRYPRSQLQKQETRRASVWSRKLQQGRERWGVTPTREEKRAKKWSPAVFIRRVQATTHFKVRQCPSGREPRTSQWTSPWHPGLRTCCFLLDPAGESCA